MIRVAPARSRRSDEVHVVLLEPRGTLHPGNVSTEWTVANPERL